MARRALLVLSALLCCAWGQAQPTPTPPQYAWNLTQIAGGPDTMGTAAPTGTPTTSPTTSPSPTASPTSAPGYLCATEAAGDLDFCMGFEYDSTADDCEAEQGYPAGGTPDANIGERNCENPQAGTTSAPTLGVPEGVEDFYAYAGAGGSNQTWTEQFTAVGDDIYIRFCLYTHDYEEFPTSFFWPKSSADAGTGDWQGSGSGGGKTIWHSADEHMSVVCPTNGSTVESSDVALSPDEWHQITLRFDYSTPAAPECSIWVDRDSDSVVCDACDDYATIAGSGMSGLEDIDGYKIAPGSDNVAFQIDMIQTDGTETHLTDVFDDDCKNN